MSEIRTVEELDALCQEVGHLVVMTNEGPALVWMGEDQGWHSVRACTEDDWAAGERRLGVPAGIDLNDDDCLPLTVLWHDGMRPDAPVPAVDDREVRARAARVLFDQNNIGMDDEWRDMAWADMGGGEPDEERIVYELQAAALSRAGLLAARQPAPVDGETVTEWGVQRLDPWDGNRPHVTAHETEAQARESARQHGKIDAVVVRREVTAWTEARTDG